MPARMESQPTLGEFISRVVEKYGVEKKDVRATIVGPKGETRISYLYREVDGLQCFSPLQGISDELALLPSVVRRLCADLRIPLSEFDITLEDFESYSFGAYGRSH